MCNYRASSPGTEAVQSCMIDDISLEDVEQFEERRLAKVRRKVSRVDSLKKFLFSSKLEDKKVKQVENIHYISRPLVTNVEQSYKASCLEVHDRWLGVQNVLKEEEEDEDNVSCMVNINMDIRTSSQLDSRFDMDTRSPDSTSSVMMNNTHTTHHMMPPHCEHRYHQHAALEKIDRLHKPNHELRLQTNKNMIAAKPVKQSLLMESSRLVKMEESSGYDSDMVEQTKTMETPGTLGEEQTTRLSRSVSQPSHNLRMKVLHNHTQLKPGKQQYMVSIHSTLQLMQICINFLISWKLFSWVECKYVSQHENVFFFCSG